MRSQFFSLRPNDAEKFASAKFGSESKTSASDTRNRTNLPVVLRVARTTALDGRQLFNLHPNVIDMQLAHMQFKINATSHLRQQTHHQ